MKQSNPFFNKTYAIEKFEEPWHAQLFALTINLNDNQIFSWSEWVAVFSRNLNGVEKCNESKTGYFICIHKHGEIQISNNGFGKRFESV